MLSPADRKQKTRAMMYKKLWWCILCSIIVTFGFFPLPSLAVRMPISCLNIRSILDGWLNIVYLFDIAFVAYLWRPTANNRRFAMSDELAQDDDAFEIRSFGSGPMTTMNLPGIP
ncbi:hypothetical protein V8E54_002308 [Elaphomyces granulatus]